jgi:sulfatase maturation enzyme AslB (radical SAM superfamily)
MLTRREASGLHLYDRRTGIHCLLAEVAVPGSEAALCEPRHLSVALTKRCNLACHYCYSDNNGEDMPAELFGEVCAAAAGQVLDLTLGGGECQLRPLKLAVT